MISTPQGALKSAHISYLFSLIYFLSPIPHSCNFRSSLLKLLTKHFLWKKKNFEESIFLYFVWRNLRDAGNVLWRQDLNPAGLTPESEPRCHLSERVTLRRRKASWSVRLRELCVNSSPTQRPFAKWFECAGYTEELEAKLSKRGIWEA